MGPNTEQPWKPTKQQLAEAEGKTVPDIIGPNLRVLFVGINPGLYSGAVAHHFARPGNRFWPLLSQAGFTPRLLSCFDERRLLEQGIGITNFVERATAAADELSPREMREGAERLTEKVCRYEPAHVAVLGMQCYRVAFGRPKAVVGLQTETLCKSRLWVLPNPSGLQAHYQMPDMLALFRELKEAAQLPHGPVPE